MFSIYVHITHIAFFRCVTQVSVTLVKKPFQKSNTGFAVNKTMTLQEVMESFLIFIKSWISLQLRKQKGILYIQAISRKTNDGYKKLYSIIGHKLI